MAPPSRPTDTALADSMADVGPAGIVLFEGTPPFRVLWTNKAYLDLWPEPLRSRGLVGLALAEFIPDAEEAGVAEVFRDVASTRTTRHIQEFRYPLADGVHWFNWSLSPVVRDGEVVALANMAVDITREVLVRKDAERVRDEQHNAAELLELGDALCELDSEYRVVRVNAQQEQLTGVPRTRSLGKTHWELWPETGDPDSPWWREYHRCMVERVPVEFEVYYAPLDLWSHVTGYPTRSGGIAIFFRDVTKRKRAEAALDAERMRWRGVVEGIADEVWVCDAEGRMTLINLPDVTALGLAPFEGQAIQEVLANVDIFYPDGRPRPPDEAPLLRSVRTGEIVRGEEIMRVRASGRVRHRQFSCAPMRDETGAITGAVAIVRDVTAAKVADEALRASEAKLRSVLENMSEGLMLFDAEGNLVFQNPASLRIHGFAPEADGRIERSKLPTTWEAWDHTGRPITFDEWPVSRVFRGERFQDQVLHVRRVETGQEFHASYNGSPIRDAHGKIVLGFITIRDITTQVRATREEARAQAAVRAANEKLRDADRRKDEFLGMLSHELRNPLAPIRNATFILQRAAPGSEQARRAQGVIERQTEHLTRLVDDLLDVTRIARGKIELRRSPVDLREVVVRAAEDFRLLMDDRGVVFRTVIPDEKVWADVDATRMTQVVGNLLHNAAKFTRRGDEAALTLSTRPGEAVITLRDSGAGIDAALLPAVFDAFVQGERTLARTDGGLGLGLALVKGITELHGGSVAASSAGTDRGAEFVVRIPVAASPSERAAQPLVRRRNGARRVLVVDDNHDAAESLADLVRMLGHEAEVAYDGSTAVSMAQASRPDVVLCDIGLPGMDGYAVARALRAAATDGMQLVAVSGYAQPEDVRKAVEAGFDAHVAKPPDPGQIERLLG